MNSEQLFYLQDSRSTCGSSAMFWAESGGYTTDLSKAEKFTRERAVRQYESRDTDIPVPCGQVEDLSYLAIDMQVIGDDPYAGEGSEFIHYEQGTYDGNNVWFCGFSRNTFDLRQAMVYAIKPEPCDCQNMVVLTLRYAKEIARPVVPASATEKRMRGWFRKHKIKVAKKLPQRSLLNRFNCPECGRIVWDQNPYGDGFCRDHWRR